MTLAEIIERFHVLVDNQSELPTDVEEAIANEEYQNICSDRPWEFLKTSATGTLSTSVPYVALPDNFASLCENNQETGTVGVQGDMGAKVIFIGSNYNPYPVVNWSDRRQYVNQEVFYIDIANNRLYKAKQPTSADSYEFDYLKVPETLTSGTSPIFPARFHEIIAYKMAVRDDVIQRFERARSYLAENQAKAQEKFNAMCLWNANLRND